jgi:chemotaxis protein methyltransferase CheR
MPLESSAASLSRELSLLGLDIGRYTEALRDDFLSRWPIESDWSRDDVRNAMISTFAIGETTFLRHPEHFQAVRALLPKLRSARGDAPLRVFSAGCASGEEVYSLAAACVSVDGQPAQVIGWDLNPDAIARAQHAEYRPWSLRGVEAGSTLGWLSPSPCGVRVEDWLRSGVELRVGNLHVDPFPTDLDLVFCRNVLLYFRGEAAASVIERIANALRPGGVLFLGHYDPRPGPGIALQEEQYEGIVFYRKPLGTLRLSNVPRARMPSIIPAARKSPVAMVTLDPANISLEAIRVLANQRHLAHALSLLATLRDKSPLDPELHVLTALVAEDAGDVKLMLEAARRACFLRPEEPAPNYFLSVAFIRNGELRRAAVHRRLAASGLRRASAEQPLALSEGLTAGQLRRLLGAIAR